MCHLGTWEDREKNWKDGVPTLFHTAITPTHQISLLAWPTVGRKPIGRGNLTWEGRGKPM